MTQGTLVTRKRDGARGRIVRTEMARSGSFAVKLYHVRLDDQVLNAAAGGDQVGPGSWLRSYYRKG